MGEKGTAAWHGLKYAGLVHILNPFSHPENQLKLSQGMDNGELHLDDGRNIAWDDERGQWIDVSNGQTLSSAPDAASDTASH